jgi:hypothetical protein
MLDLMYINIALRIVLAVIIIILAIANLIDLSRL